MGKTFSTGLLTNGLWQDSSNNIGIGASANASFKLQVTGATNLTGALSGTSATFSGAVVIGNDNAYALTIGRYSAGIPITYIKASTSSTGGFRLTNHNGADVIIVNGSNAITLDGATTTTGAATFSSSVTFANGATNNIGSDKFFLGSGGYNYLYCRSTGLQILNQADTAALVTILNGGNVGIGTSSPTFADGMGLHINNNTGAARLHLTNNTTGGAATDGSEFTLAGSDLYIINNESANTLFYNGGSPRMTITSGGNVGIGVTPDSNKRLMIKAQDTSSGSFALLVQNSAPDNLFFIRNDGYMFFGLQENSPYNIAQSGRTCILASNGSVGYLSSTKESKTNIENLSDISWLYQLNPVSFNYRKKDNDNNYTNEAENEKWYGLIADEVESVNQDLVFYNTKEDGTKQLAGVEYNKLIAALIKSSQEQQAQIEELTQKVNALENKA
jgi:hypothetical protein